MLTTRRSVLMVGMVALYVPCLYLVYAGLNNSQFLGTSFRGITLKWLNATLVDQRFWTSFGVTLATAIVVGLISVSASLLLAFAFHVGDRWFQVGVVLSLLCLFLTSSTAYSLNLLEVGRLVGLDKGRTLQCVAQVALAVPSIFALIVISFRWLPWEQFEAAVLLGRKPLAALIWFLRRELKAVLLAGFFVAMFVSLDDLVTSVYLRAVGDSPSLTEIVWQSMKSDLSPVVAWYSLALSVVGACLAVVAGRTLATMSQEASDGR